MIAFAVTTAAADPPALIATVFNLEKKGGSSAFHLSLKFLHILF
jgi:hypothetical protein